MKKGGERLQLAIDNLADLFISGHIQAAADPVGFLDRVVEEIVSLRAKFDTMHLRVTPQQKEIKELKKEVDDL